MSKEQEKRAIGAQVAQDHLKFEEETRQKAKEKFERNQAHQREVKRQMEIRSQILKTVGNNVVVNN